MSRYLQCWINFQGVSLIFLFNLVNYGIIHGKFLYLPLSWYNYSCLSSLNKYFQKNNFYVYNFLVPLFMLIIFFINRQKTLIPLFSIYIIINYLNKWKIKKYFFLYFWIIHFQIRTLNKKFSFFFIFFFKIYFRKLNFFLIIFLKYLFIYLLEF